VLFVGEELTHTSASRELFLKMIQAMGLQSDQIKVLEAHKDSDRLKDEILSHNPQTVVIFGNTALPALFAQNSSVIDLRGRIHFFENIKVIATHHPALCLINPALKKPVWEDLQIVIQTLGLKS
jgi:DNA polymerase